MVVLRDKPDIVDGGPNDLLQPIHFATASLPKQQQFEAWRTFMSPAVEMSLADLDVGFGAEQTVWDLGSAALTHATMPGEGFRRSWRHLKRKSLDHWCLVLVQSRSGRNLYIRSLAQPFEGSSDDSSVISLYVPRDLFAGTGNLLDAVGGDIPETGLGKLLADYVASLEKRLPEIAITDLPKLVEATRTMISACLSPTVDHIEAAQEAIAGSLIERARTIVQKNLLNPSFGPEQLGGLLGVSRSRLYRLFEPLGGVTRYIRRQRLLAAHAALSDLQNNGHIVQIAESLGFGDASGFSRAFKQEFGYSPTYARAAGSMGVVLPFAPPAPLRLETSNLGDVLWRLHA